MSAALQASMAQSCLRWALDMIWAACALSQRMGGRKSARGRTTVCGSRCMKLMREIRALVTHCCFGGCENGCVTGVRGV